MDVLRETGLHNMWSSSISEIVFLTSLKWRRKHFLADMGILQDSYYFQDCSFSTEFLPLCRST